MADPTDDLISELAKLMAQDAEGDRPKDNNASGKSAAPFSLRIPGEPLEPAGPRPDAAAPSRPASDASPALTPVAAPPRPHAPAGNSAPPPVPRASVPAPAPRAPVVPPAAAQPSAAPPNGTQPIAPQPSVVSPSAAQSVAPQPIAAQPVRVAPQPVRVPPQPAPTPTPVTSAAPPPTSAAPPRDSIADLIAAEFAMVPDDPVVVSEPHMASPHEEEPGERDAGAQHRSNPNALQDEFSIPPVFGMPAPVDAASARPVAPEPVSVRPEPVVAPKSDPVVAPPSPPVARVEGSGAARSPIGDIENLIGNAIRVNAEPSVRTEPVVAKPAPSPALRSLATPTLKRPPEKPSASPADAAILAAAESSGAQIGWVDTPETDIETAAPQRTRRSFRMPRPRITMPRPRIAMPRPRFALSRSVVGPLVAVLLLGAAGGGLYWVLGLERDTGPAPLLTADAAPTKEVPPATPEGTPAQQSVVFNEIDGVVPGAEEQLVSRDQADVNEVTQVAVPPVTEEGLANRKVRTVTVRPDGTIVSGDNSVAGSTMLPVARPNVPELPGAEGETPSLLASTEPNAASALSPTPASPATGIGAVPAGGAGALPPIGAETVPPTGNDAVPPPGADALTPLATAPVTEPPVPQVTPVTPGATVPAVDAAGNPLAGRTAVVPLQRPASFSQSAVASAAAQATAPVNAVVDGALPSLPPAPQQPSAPATSDPLSNATEVGALGNDAPAYVQLASQRSEAEARQTAAALVNRYGPLFGGANMEVQRVDLGARGIFYRVRVPANSNEQAANICTNVKAAGGDCIVL